MEAEDRQRRTTSPVHPAAVSMRMTAMIAEAKMHQEMKQWAEQQEWEKNATAPTACDHEHQAHDDDGEAGSQCSYRPPVAWVVMSFGCHQIPPV